MTRSICLIMFIICFCLLFERERERERESHETVLMFCRRSLFLNFLLNDEHHLCPDSKISVFFFFFFFLQRRFWSIP